MSPTYIVEADGGSRGNPGPAAYGTVVRTAEGRLVAEQAAYLGNTTNNVAEYNGMLAGLEIVNEIDPDAVIHVRLDSKLVVEQMSGRWKIKNADLRDIAMTARKAFAPERVTYEWIPRELNKAADALVNECLDQAARGRPEMINRRY